MEKPGFTETVKGSWFHSRNVVVPQKSGEKIQFKSDKTDTQSSFKVKSND